MLEGLREITLGSIVLRMVLSLILGGVLGLERGMKNRPAGFRTYMLVCLGASLVMMTNQYIYITYNKGDIVRMGAQVISGIGFLGAGTIVVTGRQQIKGITTAAGLWTAACCGLAIGIGFYEGAILGGVTVFVVMSLMDKVETIFRKKSPLMDIYLEYTGKKNFSTLLGEVRARGLEITNIQMNKNHFANEGELCLIINVESKEKRSHADILAILTSIDGVDYVEEL